jgi:type III secretion system-like peptide-binding chaperone
MPLFGSRTPAPGHRLTKLIESVLQDLGLEPSQAAISSRDGPMWGLLKGSAEVYVAIIETDGESFVQVTAPIMEVPENPTALFKRLLELNCDELSGAAFGVRGDRVVVTLDRPAIDIDRVQLKEMIVRAGTYADHFDDLLVVEFGGRKHSEA